MSAKPSDSSTPLLRDLVPPLLLDENLSSPEIGAWLRRFPNEWQIELHTDHLTRGLPDVDVIRECGERGWTLVSCDDRIRYVPANKAALLKHRVRAFMFGKGNYQGIEYAAALVVGRAQVLNAIRKNHGPFMARIQRNGDVQMLEPKDNAAGEVSSREKTKRKYGAHVLET